LTADPLGGSAHLSSPGTLNRYAYSANDPVNRHDPSGLDDGGPDDPSASGDPTFVVNVTDPGDPDYPFIPSVWEDDSGGTDLNAGCWLGPACEGLEPFLHWQSGGPPKAVQNKGGLRTNPAAAAQVAWRYLNSVWQDCLTDFEPRGLMPQRFRIC
jgi:hypothetical protein